MIGKACARVSVGTGGKERVTAGEAERKRERERKRKRGRQNQSHYQLSQAIREENKLTSEGGSEVGTGGRGRK